MDTFTVFYKISTGFKSEDSGSLLLILSHHVIHLVVHLGPLSCWNTNFRTLYENVIQTMFNGLFTCVYGSGLYFSVFLFDEYIPRSDLNKFTFVSSDQRTIRHFSLDRSTWSLANFSLYCTILFGKIGRVLEKASGLEALTIVHFVDSWLVNINIQITFNLFCKINKIFF